MSNADVVAGDRARFVAGKHHVITQVLAANAGLGFQRGAMLGGDRALGLDPLPNETLGDAEPAGGGGLAPELFDGLLDCGALAHAAKLALLVSPDNSTARSSRRTVLVPSRRMGSRRELTVEERRAAERFRALLLASDKTQEQIASEIGVTQGAVWQWADGKVPISAKRAVAIAGAVGAHPSEISVAWRESHLPPEESASQALTVKASQPVRPDFQKMADASFLLNEYLEVVRGDRDKLFNARLLELAYEVVELHVKSKADNNVIDLVKYLARKVEEAGGQNGGGSGGTETASASAR